MTTADKLRTDGCSMTDLHEAIALLQRGDWEAAHVIAQDDATDLGSWAHGIVHIMEGDMWNAGYWYRRAGRKLPRQADVEAEIEALKSAAGL